MNKLTHIWGAVRCALGLHDWIWKASIWRPGWKKMRSMVVCARCHKRDTITGKSRMILTEKDS